MNSNMKKEDKKNILKDYAGMSFQFLVGLGLFMFAGYKIDEWMKFTTPLTIWLFPLIFITAAIVKIILETNKK
jgi:Na+/glutamate symporter